MEELAKGTFHEVIPDTVLKDAKKVNTALLCSGKVYYDLLEEREKQGSEKTAIIRVEQIYPTPAHQIIAAMKIYPNLKSVAWVQEEPKNMGAWQFICFKIQFVLAKEFGLELQYIGRSERASPATGSLYRHKVEQSEIVQSALKL